MMGNSLRTHVAQDSSRRPLGVVYIAFGADYLAMALHSARSLRSVGCELPVHMVTNVRPRDGRRLIDGIGGLTFHILKATRSSNRLIKTSQNDYSPFLTTLYVDCDTEFLEDPEESLRSFEGTDLVLRKLTKALSPKGTKGRLEVHDGMPASRLPHWNSSVIVYRRTSAVDSFFAYWHGAFIRQGFSYDQIALVEAALAVGPALHSVDRFDFIRHYSSRMPRSVAESCSDISKDLFHGFEKAVALSGIVRRRRRANRATRLVLTVPVWAAWSVLMRLESHRWVARAAALADAVASGRPSDA